jgi:hypothetical protein
VFFAPLILLERSRGIWRVWLILLYGLLAVLSVGYAVRTQNLARIPDVTPSLNLAAFRDGVPDDAFPLYIEAIKRFEEPSRLAFVGEPRLVDQIRTMRYNGEFVTPGVRSWIDKNRPALELWRQATERSVFGYHTPGQRGIGTESIWYGIAFNRATGAQVPISPHDFDIDRGMLPWLAGCEASRLHKNGDAAGAWTWIRALLRYSRHVGMRAGFAERRTAVERHAAAAELAETWATDPNVDPALLRRALADVLDVGKLTPPLSDTLKADYLETLHLIDHPTLPVLNRVAADYGRDGEPTDGDQPPSREEVRFAEGDWSGTESDPYRSYLPDVRARIVYYMRHEPETSRRLVAQVYANWLDHCDESANRRPSTVSPFELYDTPPSRPGMLAVPTLIEALNGPRVARHVISPWSDLEKMVKDEQTRQAQLVVALAEQLYIRERGTPPPMIRALVGSYLKEIPEGYVDPLKQASPAPLFQLRR